MTAHTTGRSCSSHVLRGLTCERYESLVSRANGVCQICRSDRYLVLDHDHAVGAWAVRGLLCSRCNAWLDLLKGPEVDLYLASPWYRENPDHPVTPTRSIPTSVALLLYERLDQLTELFRAAAKADRPRIRGEAEDVGLLLLTEGEMAKDVVARAPFSVAHLRNVARSAGFEPSKPGPRIGYKAEGPLTTSQ